MLAALDVRWIPVFAGPLVVASYLTASLVPRLLRPHHPEVGTPGRVAALVGAAHALGAATLAWVLLDWIAPGTAFSPVGFLSAQVLTPWQSVALWVGLASVAGQAVPLGGGRGTWGLAPATALLAAYAPLTLAAAGLGLASGAAVAPERRLALVGAFGSVLAWVWLAWTFEWEAFWGVRHGPELALWSVGLVVVLHHRWREGDVLAPAA